MTMKFRYLSLRLIRHFMPRSLTHFLLRHNLVIQPGYETRQPAERVTQYQTVLEQFGRTLQGQSILNFGYGGNFALACGLLQAGASHVTLLDKFAPPDDHFNQPLLAKFPQYLALVNGQVRPRSEVITLSDDDLHNVAEQPDRTRYDIVLSSSVYEHLDDVDGITRSMALLTKPEGCQVHYIDLRDHYFKYPFEMLTFSEKTWKTWLNPGSNLNRFRLNDYRCTFEHYYAETHLEVLERDLANFEQARGRIDPKFLIGDPEVDAVTLLLVFVATPAS